MNIIVKLLLPSTHEFTYIKLGRDYAYFFSIYRDYMQ